MDGVKETRDDVVSAWCLAPTEDNSDLELLPLGWPGARDHLNRRLFIGRGEGSTEDRILGSKALSGVDVWTLDGDVLALEDVREWWCVTDTCGLYGAMVEIASTLDLRTRCLLMAFVCGAALLVHEGVVNIVLEATSELDRAGVSVAVVELPIVSNLTEDLLHRVRD